MVRVGVSYPCPHLPREVVEAGEVLRVHGLADELLPHHRRERERELGVLLAERHAEELAHEGEGLELRRREGGGRLGLGLGLGLRLGLGLAS